ncbi:TatD family hydrolase [Pelistega europaea]|uniref:TatD family hydrolase n=1 Tax=Pelistega europaea TaxID=106147 RepID=A0A7Y4L8I3_9BURK|nr:TatD family hydrolase [Pelistega europaea]NOL48940.1 TatD family hydrolase [Pelistega europaea]
MFIDSHCHLDFPELKEDLPNILANMQQNQVRHALCVSVNMPDWPGIMEIVATYPQLSASVGVHPDYEDTPEPSVEELVRLTQHPKVVAIGETGLDYYRLVEPLEWQRERFRTHIRAAIQAQLPLIIHTRNASEDTIRVMREERAERCGGVMHCFTETKEVAQQALDLGFYISMSGIVTFKNAQQVQEVATYVPLDRLLIETDSPYLAPVPYRGKRNDPSKVMHVAEKIAELRGLTLAEVGKATSDNFYRLFSKVSQG